MEAIHIISDAFKQVLEKLDHIDHRLDNIPAKPLTENWLDIEEACILLKISKRTLQSYRDNGILPFSQVGGKIYFRASDIEAHLRRHYIKAFHDKR